MKVTFLCVWSFLKDCVTWEDLLSRTLKLSLLLRIMCVISLSGVSSGGCACDRCVEPAAVSLISGVFLLKAAAHTHTHINPVSTWSSFAVCDDGVYWLCAQLLSQAWFSSWLFCPFPPIFLLLRFLSIFSFLPPDSSSPPSQAKVRELEEKCRTQSEQFNLLSKELEKFRLHAGKFDILSTEPLTVCESPGSPNKSLSQLLNGLAAPIGKGRTTQPSYQPFRNCVVIISSWIIG